MHITRGSSSQHGLLTEAIANLNFMLKGKSFSVVGKFVFLRENYLLHSSYPMKLDRRLQNQDFLFG